MAVALITTKCVPFTHLRFGPRTGLRDHAAGALQPWGQGGVLPALPRALHCAGRRPPPTACCCLPLRPLPTAAVLPLPVAACCAACRRPPPTACCYRCCLLCCLLPTAACCCCCLHAARCSSSPPTPHTPGAHPGRSRSSTSSRSSSHSPRTRFVHGRPWKPFPCRESLEEASPRV